MKVKFLTSIASEDWGYHYGQIAYLERTLAEKWIAAGFCIALAALPSEPETVAEQPAAPSNKPKSADLRQRVEQTRGQIEQKQNELAKVLRSAEEAGVDAIITGKRSQAPALLSKSRDLQGQIEELRTSLQPLERALAVLEQEEAETARQTEEKRVAALRTKYREAVNCLIETIEAGNNDPMGTFRIQEAETTLASIALQFPEQKRPAQVNIANPSTITCDEQMRLHLYAHLCEQGFADLFPSDHIARRRHEHQAAHDKQDRDRRILEQMKRQQQADAALIPDEQTSIPGLGARVIYQ